ncbi:MAG: CPBP family glutamic-type intramembrane protease, partial [Planctomycetota bacterium]
ALFAAVLLPALLYPLMFWGQTELLKGSRALLAAREVNIALDLTRADSAVAARARVLLEQHTPIQVFDVDALPLFEFDAGEAALLDPEPASVRRRAIVQDLMGGSAHIVITGEQHPSVNSRTRFRIYYDIKDDAAREAADRAASALSDLELELSLERRRRLLPSDPALGLDLIAVDVASAEDASGAKLGRLLPLLAVLVLLSGGSYAALSVFAGERESGTLETLLVQPVPARTLARGKFLAVLAAGLVTLASNLGSIVACMAAGLGELPGAQAVGGLSLARAAAGFVYLPGAVLVCSVLCWVCGRARTFREGQMTILPVMLLTALPTAICLQPSVETTLLLAATPFAGPALSLRDALGGSLSLLPTLVMIASHAFYSWLVLGRLSNILDLERTITSDKRGAESAEGLAASHLAQRWGFIAVLALYVIGGRLQAWSFETGLVLTFWVLLPLLILGAARHSKKLLGVGARIGLSLRLPAPQHLLGALLLAPGISWLMTVHFLPLQESLLPLPEQAAAAESLAAIFGALDTWKVIFLFALSPGIWEELLYRGALLSHLRRDLGGMKAVLWQALFFAAAHASIYRLVPTGILGLVLGALTLRSRSILPAMVLHLAYNAGTMLVVLERLGERGEEWWTRAAWLAPVGLALCLLPAKESRKS